MRAPLTGSLIFIIYYVSSAALCAESKRESIICTPLLTGSIVFNFLIDDSVTVCVKLPSMHSSLSAPVINENAHPARSESQFWSLSSLLPHQLSQHRHSGYLRTECHLHVSSSIHLFALATNIFVLQWLVTQHHIIIIPNAIPNKNTIFYCILNKCKLFTFILKCLNFS